MAKIMKEIEFEYYVTDEHLEQFAKLSSLEKLRWHDEARRFVLMVRASESKQSISDSPPQSSLDPQIESRASSDS